MNVLNLNCGREKKKEESNSNVFVDIKENTTSNKYIVRSTNGEIKQK